MAHILTKRGAQDNIVTYEHMCDTHADLNNIPKNQMTLGSTAIVLRDEDDALGVYMSDSNKEWVSLLTIGGETTPAPSPVDLLHVLSSSDYDPDTHIPTVENPEMNVVYLVPSGEETGNNLFDEWIYTGDSWERFGGVPVNNTAVQADWNEDDESADAHILNRPNVRKGSDPTGVVEGMLQNVASGTYSHAEGNMTTASGQDAHAEGQFTSASGDISHAEGSGGSSTGLASHVEGTTTSALGMSAHAEGTMTVAQGAMSHAEGFNSLGLGDLTHVEGGNTSQNITLTLTGAANATTYTYLASDNSPINLRNYFLYYYKKDLNTSPILVTAVDTANLTISFESTLSTTSISNRKYILMSGSIARGNVTHAEGWARADEQFAHAEGYQTHATIIAGHAEGYQSEAYNSLGMQGMPGAHAEGYQTRAQNSAHAEGTQTHASGQASHAEGTSTTATMVSAHAEGTRTQATNQSAHAEGTGTKASGTSAHAEGTSTQATQQDAHAEGTGTKALHMDAHAEGLSTIANGDAAHTEGQNTLVYNNWGHAEGRGTLSDGTGAHAEGDNNGWTPVTVTLTHLADDSANVYHYSNASNELPTIAGHIIINDGYRRITAINTSDKTITLSYTLGIPDDKPTSFVIYSGPIALSKGAHAEGVSTEANSTGTHAEGCNTRALQANAHAEGYYTEARGYESHTEGYGTIATGDGAHAEGYGSLNEITINNMGGTQTTYSFQPGAYATGSHVEGLCTYANKIAAHAEGYNTVANQNYAHAEGSFNFAQGESSHSEGSYNNAQGSRSHAEGAYTAAIGQESHSEGSYTSAKATASHAEGYYTVANAIAAHVEGYGSNNEISLSYSSGTPVAGTPTTFKPGAEGPYSHVEGAYSYAGSTASHAEGYETCVMGAYSHAEGYMTSTSNQGAHAEGYQTIARGMNAHAEGEYNLVAGQAAHAEGSATCADGNHSHTEGEHTTASSINSHAEGSYTTAVGKAQHVFGEFNEIDTAIDGLENRSHYVEIVGNGEDNNSRSNARTLDWAGNETLAGALTCSNSITIGNTTVTEAQLQALLALLP